MFMFNMLKQVYHGTLCLFTSVIIITFSFSLSVSARTNNILVMGDSLSAAHNIPESSGWVTLLSEKIKANYPDWQVINQSISGETSSGGKQRLPKLLEKFQPSIVILELGGNDGLRGFPPFVTKRNLSEMIEAAQKADAHILLVGMKLPPNYTQAYTKAFEAVFVSIQETYDLPWIPFLLENVALDPTLMQSDGIHPNEKAQPKILNNVYPVLENMLKS